MKQWDFANTLTLMQNGLAVIYLGAGRYAGMLDMKPFAAQQWKVFGKMKKELRCDYLPFPIKNSNAIIMN